LHDSALEEAPDHFEAEGNWAKLSNDLLGYAYMVMDFEEVDADLSNPSDKDDADPDAVDFVLTMHRWS
jgi:hypothetical protein